MHRSHKKIIASVSLLLVAVLVVTTISISHTHTVSAQPSFQGIQSIVAGNTVDAPFSVVELVPSNDMAAFGYLVDGNEPVAGIDAETGKAVLWQDAVKQISGTDNRVRWMEEKQEALKNICGTDEALTYKTYEETYAVVEDDEENWTKVSLTTEDSIAAETTGYRMEDVGDGYGAYVLNESFALSDAANGDYDENPDYFVYSNNGYYSLAFAVIAGSKGADSLESLQALVGGNGAYAVTSASIYTSEDAFDAFRSDAANKKCAIYAVPRSDLSANFTYIGMADEVKLSKDIDSGSTTDPDTGDGSGSGSENGDGSGTDTGNGSGTDTGDGSGTETGDGTGTDAGDGTETGDGTGTDAGNGSETGDGNGTDAGNGTETGDGSSTDAGSGSETGDGSNTDAGSGSETGDGSDTGAGTESGSGTGTGTGTDTGSESGGDAASGTDENATDTQAADDGESVDNSGSTDAGTDNGDGNGADAGNNSGAGTDAGTDNGSNSGNGTDSGDNSGDGTDSGNGSGTDAGDNSGDGTDNGNGSGTDTGDNSGDGTDSGNGSGTDAGDNSGDGTDSGNGSGTDIGDNSGTDNGNGYDNGDNTVTDPLVLDFGNYWYYSVIFEYVPNDNLQVGNYYYSVIPSKTVFNRAQDAQYSASLNVAHPYVRNEAGTGNFKCTSDPMYRYVGEWNGRYTLVSDPSGKLDYEVQIPYYYYKGGFSSNNLFKDQVFNQDGTLDARNMYFDVTTTVPTAFEQYLEQKGASQIDLLFISGSGSVSGKFSASDDIQKSTVESIVKQVYDNAVCMPVIADYSIIASEVDAAGGLSRGAAFGTASDVTNVQRLVALLCAANFSSLVTDVSTFDLDAVAWESLTFSQDADHHYINKNIYVIPGNAAGEVPFILADISDTIVSGDSDTAFENNAKDTGFEELVSYIINENFIRQAESMGTDASYELFDRKVTKAIAIEYCISYLQKREQTVKHDIHVLDIEPRQTNSDYEGKLQTKITKWFTDAGYQLDSLTVTTVPMAEFIGKIDDLASYDMIYFGLNTDYYNMSGGLTAYNDTAMNGLIYSNVGDITVVNSKGSIGAQYPWSYSGMLESDYQHSFNNSTGLLKRLNVITAESTVGSNKKAILNASNRTETFRLSGNDLTKQKYNEIIDYIKGGFPVVFADDFMNGTDVNEVKIDNCTYIYELVKDQIANENVMTETTAITNTAKLYRYISLNKPVVTVSGLTKTTGKEYVTLNSSKVSFNFQIENLSAADGEADFDCMLYFDSNADGRFSTSEAVIASDITISKNGKRIKPVDGHYSLQAGEDITYSLSYHLPDSYVGIIPWKLKISQNDNEYRYNSVSGYFYIKNTAGKQVVNILQINTANDSSSNLNMQKEMEKSSSTFKKLVNSLDDFTLNIKTISGSEYTNGYTEIGGVAYVTVGGSQVRLDSFDMLVLGFADLYELKDGTNNCFKGLQEYIDAGKPVLCTHDTTSTSNDSTATYWGYDYNTLLRNYVGMDRYGILSNQALKLGLTLSGSDTSKACLTEKNNGTKRYYIIKNADGTYRYTTNQNASGTVTIKQLFEDAVASAEASGTDIAYEPRSGKTKIVKQNQGMTDLSLMFQIYGMTGETYRAADYVNYASNSKIKDSWQTTTTAVRVNEGQITTYPFAISDTLKISSTHYQYYQLDMNEDEDNDGESDIVVWYTLSGSDQHNSIYTTAEKDVRNNYYIYTKGNITYSGVGHSSVTSEDELKLYINTMIAAYSAGLHAPSVSIRQSSDEDAPAVDTIYLSYDATQNAILEEELGRDYSNPIRQKFYFTVNDSNLIKNMRSKEEFVDFYIEVTKAEYDANKSWGPYIEHDGIYLKKQNWTIYRADGSALSTTNNEDGIQNGWYDWSTGKYHLVSGTTYCVELDMSSLISAASYNGQQFKGSTRAIKVYLGAYTKITYNNYASTVTDTDISYYGFEVRQLELVDLD